jgi:hypothetical protein
MGGNRTGGRLGGPDYYHQPVSRQCSAVQCSAHWLRDDTKVVLLKFSLGPAFGSAVQCSAVPVKKPSIGLSHIMLLSIYDHPKMDP